MHTFMHARAHMLTHTAVSWRVAPRAGMVSFLIARRRHGESWRPWPMLVVFVERRSVEMPWHASMD